MKQLTQQQPLCYILDHANLVNSLPYADQTLQAIPASKIAYLIKTQQDTMNNNPNHYIKDLPFPTLNYANSLQFDDDVKRVEQKIAKRDQGQRQKKAKKEIVYPQPPKKLISGEEKQVSVLVNSGILNYQYTVSKNINVQLYKKYGPLILKQLIEVLDKEKTNLLNSITKETDIINEINKNRKYMQTESYQRQYDIAERIKIMLNKRKKIE